MKFCAMCRILSSPRLLWLLGCGALINGCGDRASHVVMSNVGRIPIHVGFAAQGAKGTGAGFALAPGESKYFLEWPSADSAIWISSASRPAGVLVKLSEQFQSHRIRGDFDYVIPVDETGKVYPVSSAE